MAEIRDGFSLAKIPGESSLVGVESGESDYQVIVTSTTGFLNVYELSDQKLVHSWSLQHGIHTTSSAVWCPAKENYFTVQNKQQIKSWASNTTNLKKAKQTHLRKPVFKILIYDDFPPIVVCENGCVDFFDNIEESCCKETWNQVGEQLLWCDCFVHNNSINVVLVTQSKDSKVMMHTRTYQADTETWTNISRTLKKEAKQFYCCCLSKKTNRSLLTLWQNGELIETALTESRSADVCEQVFTISGVVEDCSMVALDHTHVAIAGIQQNGDVGIGIFNIKFQALQTMRVYPEKVLSKPHLFCHHKHMFLACNKTLYAFPYECGVSTVARLLGQRNKAKNKASNEVTTVKVWGSKGIKKESSKKVDNRAENTTNIENMLKKLTGSTKELTESQFEKEFSLLVGYLKKSNLQQWVNNQQISQLCQTCFSIKHFRPHKPISQLIDLGLICSSDQPALFECLSTLNDLNMMHKAIGKLSDIGEHAIIHCLQFYLDIPDEEFIKKCGSVSIPETIFETNIQCPICPSKAHFLNQLLGLSSNEVFLMERVRKLQYKNALVLMEYLHYLVQVVPVSTTQVSNNYPSIEKVVDWMSILIDAHLMQLIVSPDARMLLGCMHEVISEQVLYYSKISTLEAMLLRFKKRCAPTTQPKVGSYCIEVLHI